MPGLESRLLLLLRLAFNCSQIARSESTPTFQHQSFPGSPSPSSLDLHPRTTPRGVSSREGLALPISLCGCSTSIPVRGESRIATLHLPTLSPPGRVLLLLSSAPALPRQSIRSWARRETNQPLCPLLLHVCYLPISVPRRQAALWHPEQPTRQSRYRIFSCRGGAD